MVQESQALGVRLALVLILVLLFVMLVDSNSNFCQKCSASPDPLNRTKLMIIRMSRDTQQLYKSYLTHENLLNISHRICKVTPTSWFPGRNITRAPERTMLQELHKTAIYLDDSFMFLRQQQGELRRSAPALLKKLENASVSVKGLLHNILCALCIRGLTPASVTPLERTPHVSDFYRKLEGCQMLSSYSDFIRNLAKAFNRQMVKGRGKKGRSSRGMPLISG